MKVSIFLCGFFSVEYPRGSRFLWFGVLWCFEGGPSLVLMSSGFSRVINGSKEGIGFLDFVW